MIFGLGLAAIAMIAGLLLGIWAMRQSYRRRFLDELEQSQDNMRLIADSVPQVLWQGLPDGRVTFMNKRWTDITGASVDDGIGDDGWAWQNWFHPEDRQGLLDDWARARDTGERFDSYRRLLHSDGSYRWLQVTAQPIRSPSGETIRWYGVSTDIHAEMQAQLSVRALNQTLEQRVADRTKDLALSERRFRSIFESSHVAMIEADLTDMKDEFSRISDGQSRTTLSARLSADDRLLFALLRRIAFVEVNDAALRLLRIDRGKLLSTVPIDVVSALLAIDFLVMVVEGQTPEWQQLVQFADGEGRQIKALCSVTIVESDSRALRALISMIDVTDREATREQLLDAREELLRANRALTLSALSMSLAHDLGQPISAIAMDAASGARFLDQNPPRLGAASLALERVAAQAQRAGELLHSTREHLVRRDRTIEQSDLLHVIHASVLLMARELKSRRTQVVFSGATELSPVDVDRIELQQVVTNLLMNALHASESTVANENVIEIVSSSLPEGRMQVEVRDMGTGLPSGEEERVFDPLFSTKPGGMGMGLAISRAIMEGFGGTLTCRNNEGRGATFVLTLPPSAT